MKKLILIFAAIAITAGAYAQANSTNTKTSPKKLNNTQKQTLQNNPQDLSNTQKQHNPQDLNKKQNQNVRNKTVNKTHPDGVLMQNGQIMVVKNGKTTILDHEMTMSNGTKIMSDGTYTKKDGTKHTLKEGQHMGMSGKMVYMKSNKANNKYQVPDTTKRKAN